MNEPVETDFEHALHLFLDAAERYQRARRGDSYARTPEEREERLKETARNLRYAAAAFSRIAERAG